MARGDGETRRLRTGKSWKKCAVLPVSAITLVVPLEKREAAGGPNDKSKLLSTKLGGGEACNVLWYSRAFEFSGGFPRSQPLKRGVRGRPVEILLFPPIMLRMVAPVLWSEPGWVQVALVCAEFFPSPCVWQ